MPLLSFSQIQRLLIELHHAVLSVKSVQVVEEFYRCLMLDTTEAHAQLLHPTPPSTTHHQASLLLSICALVHIGNVKHSLIRVRDIDNSNWYIVKQ